MFYQITLFLHSWLRWPVMLLLLATLFISLYSWLARKPFTDKYQKLFAFYSGMLGIQGITGLVLFFVTSPITTYILYHNIKGITANPGITFFTLRHPLSMLIAVIICNAGKKRADKIAPEGRFRTWFIFTLVVFLIVMANIPWPSMEFGRPLFRF